MPSDLTPTHSTLTSQDRAGWALAYADVKRIRFLGPALRKAYKKGEPPFDLEAMHEAHNICRGMTAALAQAIDLLEEEDAA